MPQNRRSSCEAELTPQHFRKVLGGYPTGVCAITTVSDDAEPIAMIVGTFTSVSLDPALVGFFPAKSSYSGQRIINSRRFCVNILSHFQGALCNQIARSQDKFASLTWSLDQCGLPVLEGICGWIACDMERVSDVGDHWLVLGRVSALQADADVAPLLFWKGILRTFEEIDVIGRAAHRAEVGV